MKNSYNEDYYERGVVLGISGYSNFSWMPELTIPMCARLIEKLNIKDSDTILDFGCAKGYVVKSFRLLHKQAWGVDVSEYAITNSDKDVLPYLYLNDFKLQNNKPYDMIISKDVFEHISYEELDELVKKLSVSCKRLFCVVPLGENGKYFIPSYEQDLTHIIREPLQWWSEKFIKNGFGIEYSGYSFSGVKENYKEWENGNGFFILNGV